MSKFTFNIEKFGAVLAAALLVAPPISGLGSIAQAQAQNRPTTAAPAPAPVAPARPVTPAAPAAPAQPTARPSGAVTPGPATTGGAPAQPPAQGFQLQGGYPTAPRPATPAPQAGQPAPQTAPAPIPGRSTILPAPQAAPQAAAPAQPAPPPPRFSMSAPAGALQAPPGYQTQRPANTAPVAPGAPAPGYSGGQVAAAAGAGALAGYIGGRLQERAGAQAGAPSAFVDPSRRAPAPEVLTGTTSLRNTMPSTAMGGRAATRETGYLDSQFRSIVVAPVVLTRPFRRMQASSFGSRTSGGFGSRLARESSTDVYSDGEYGSHEINQLPAWIQASLRLMHTQQYDARPVDPRVSVKEETLEVWLERVEEAMKTGRTDLEESTRIRDMLAARASALALHSEIEELARVQPEATTKKETTAAELAQAERAYQTADAGVETARSAGGWTCRNTGYRCGDLDTAAVAARDQAETARDQARTAARTASREYDRIASRLPAAREEFERTMQRTNIADETPETELRERQVRLAASAESARRTLAEANGFVKWTPSGAALDSRALRSCRGELYIYAFSPTVGVPYHPFFGSSSGRGLAPSDSASADLAICLRNDRHLDAVYVLQRERVLYSSLIERPSFGFGDSIEIEIEDADGDTLERHSWIARGGAVRYGIEFQGWPSGAVSIYSDLR